MAWGTPIFPSTELGQLRSSQYATVVKSSGRNVWMGFVRASTRVQAYVCMAAACDKTSGEIVGIVPHTAHARAAGVLQSC